MVGTTNKPKSSKKAAKATSTKKKPAAKSMTKTAAKQSTKSTTAPAPKVRVAKSDGDSGVQAYIQKLTPWQSEIAKRLDAIVGKNAPDAQKAVKWSSPIYGMAGQGWFLAFSGFQHYVKVNFFAGASLKPQPPKGGGKMMRSIDIAEGQLTPALEKQLAAWVQQAKAIPGWGNGPE